MGYRLHCATKYIVEYLSGSTFNYKCEEFHNLLTACGADYTGDCWDSDFEVTKEDWSKAIEKLKTLNSLEAGEQSEIQEAISRMEYSVEEIISSMQNFLACAEPNSEYLHLSYF